MDILNLPESLKINIKKEQEEKPEEVKLYLPPTPGSEFIDNITQKVGGCGLRHCQVTDQVWGARTSSLIS